MVAKRPARRIAEPDVPAVTLESRLARLRLFADMSHADIAEIVRRVGGGIRHFKRDEIVVHEGVKAKWVIPVLKGRLGVYESGANGESHLARLVDAGGLFGSTLVTANLESYPGMAVAAEDSEVVFLEITKIKALWRDSHFARFFENLYSSVSGEVLDSWRKLSILACRKTEDRFMLYLRWRTAATGETELRLPFATSEACAQYLGVTRTALSLAVTRLAARGEITRLGRGRFRLKAASASA